MFQPELMAEGVDGAAVIHKRHTILELSGTDPAVKAENDLLAMLYRRPRRVRRGAWHRRACRCVARPEPCRAGPHQGRAELRDSRTTPPRPEDAEINPAFAKLEGWSST